MSQSKYFTRPSEAFRRTLFPGVEASVVSGEHMTVSVVDCAPGSVVEEHSHPHEQVGLVIDGDALFIVGDEQQQLEAGAMYCIPGGIVHKVICGPNGLRAIDVFHPNRTEYEAAAE